MPEPNPAHIKSTSLWSEKLKSVLAGFINLEPKPEPGAWGLYWFALDPNEHTEINLILSQSKIPGNRVFNCIAANNETITLKYGNATFEAKPAYFKKVEAPRFNMGDAVSETSGQKRQGIITQIIWHDKKQASYYIISINGKESSKWNFDEDLELLEMGLE